MTKTHRVLSYKSQSQAQRKANRLQHIFPELTLRVVPRKASKNTWTITCYACGADLSSTKS